MPHDLRVIVVSHNSRQWLEPALTSLLAHTGSISVEVVVVDNGSDGAAQFVRDRFPGVTTISCPNHGFGHANNQALESVDARYVLFLNPDTEFIDGSLSQLVSALDSSPEIGLAGVTQLRSDGSPIPSMRRFPSLLHAFADATGLSHLPLLRHLVGERVVASANYTRRQPCDWTVGSFMLVRTSALANAKAFDERFFLFSEEKDLCLRLRQNGWGIVHIPDVTIVHHEPDADHGIRRSAQLAFARLQFARKHSSRSSRSIYRMVLVLHYALRLGVYSLSHRRRRVMYAALVVALSNRDPRSGR